MKTLAAAYALSLSIASAQETFEVASIKPTDPRTSYGGSRVHNDAGRLMYENITLELLLIRAFGAQLFQIHGPSWLGQDRFDIAAKLPENTSPDQIPSMLQTLLQERFGLKFHWDTRAEPGFVLLVSKSGPKLTKSDESVTPMVTGPAGNRVPGSMTITSYGKLEFSSFTMTRFAKALSGDLGKIVMDLTELPGKFDISMDVDPGSLAFGFFQTTPIESKPTLANAIRDLGLKLEPRKIPVMHLVIDQINRSPSEN